MIRAAIKAISSYLPEAELTNQQLAQEFEGVAAGSIYDKTGISVRRIAADSECASDLGVAAARKLFDNGSCAPDDIDFLVFCTQSPDYFLPTSACVMQDALGLRTDCGAIDVNQGCSGYIYGLAVAKSLIESGTARNVLFVTADTYSKFINPRDRSLRTLFGDGATATYLEGVESENELVGPFVFGSDGSGKADLILPAGGLRQPVDDAARVETQDEQGNWRSACNLYMNGGSVFNFTMRIVPATIEQLLAKSGLSLDEIDYFIPHQANKFMLERLRVKLKIPADKFFCDMEKTGNTVSSSIPIAFEMAKERNLVKTGDKVALIGFGVGLSWGATLVEVQ